MGEGDGDGGGGLEGSKSVQLEFKLAFNDHKSF